MLFAGPGLSRPDAEHGDHGHHPEAGQDREDRGLRVPEGRARGSRDGVRLRACAGGRTLQLRHLGRLQQRGGQRGQQQSRVQQLEVQGPAPPSLHPALVHTR